MTRAAIYARYSSDLQHDRSIADQIALCKTIAQRAGYQIVAMHEDRALSGTSIVHRPGVQALLRDVKARKVDVVVTEHIDRITRSEADWHAIKLELDFAGVKVHAASGIVGRIEGSVLALVSATQSEAIAVHTWRGLKGAVAAGRHAGGRAYGYRPVKGDPGRLRLEDAEVTIVRRIFAEYIGGASPRAIAAGLNRDGVAPPRGAYWRASTIVGSKQRGHGILVNPVYAGRIVWNRVRMIKHPQSRKRLSRINPQSEWQWADAPQLRLVDQETFEAAAVRMAGRTHAFRRSVVRPRYLLSGLLRCGSCGAGMSSRGRDRKGRRISCSQFLEAQTCENGRGYYVDDIEHAVIGGLRVRLGSPAAIAHFVRAYNDERRRQSAQETKARSSRERELAEAQRTLDRLIDASLKELVTEEEAAARLPQLRSDRDRARAALEASAEPPRVVALHPAAVDDYLRTLDRLADVINADLTNGESETATVLRRLIESVTIMPAPARTPPTIAVTGKLEALLNCALQFPVGSLSGGRLVAGGRLGSSPPTAAAPFSFTCVAVTRAA